MSKLEWSVEELGPRIEAFLNPLLDAANLDVDYEVYDVERSDTAIGPEIAVDFQGDDTPLLTGNRAAVLMALEQLTLEALRVPHQDRYRLIFDVDDMRMLRIEELRMSAKCAADQVKRTGKRFQFRPMTSRERRILHLALRDEEQVTTFSEGDTPHRYTVVDLRGQG